MDIKDIKFKGQRIDNGEEIEGSLYKFKAAVKNTEAYFIIAGGEFNKETRWLHMCNIHEVNPETVTCDYIENIERENLRLQKDLIDSLQGKTKEYDEFNDYLIERED